MIAHALATELRAAAEAHALLAPDLGSVSLWRWIFRARTLRGVLREGHALIAADLRKWADDASALEMRCRKAERALDEIVRDQQEQERIDELERAKVERRRSAFERWMDGEHGCIVSLAERRQVRGPEPLDPRPAA